MYKAIFSFLSVFVSLILNAQEPLEPPLHTVEISSWEYDGFSHSDFGTGEGHSYFSVLHKLNPQLHEELRGYYGSYRGSDVFDLSYRVKWYPVKKLYMFSGVGVQMQRIKGGTGQPIMPIRMLNGVGYEPQKNSSIEAVHDLNFNTNSAGLNGTPSLFTIRGKYRF